MSAFLRRESLIRFSSRHPFLASLIMIGAVTAIGFSTESFLHPANLDVLYMLAVLVSALTEGRWPAVFTAVLGALVFDFCFIPPRLSFAVSDVAYLVTLGGFLAVAIITSSLAARARRVLLEQAARQQAEARNEAKDQVLHRISHELRSPLTAIMGWIQLIQRMQAQGEAPSAESLDALESSAHLLVRLVDDLLDASRAGVGKLQVSLQPVNIGPIVSNAVDAALVLARQKDVHLDSSIDPAGEIFGDDVRIEQIVTNLLSNAVKFTPAGGQIRVQLLRLGKNVQLTVSDSGIGIETEFLPHVFEAFAQAEPKVANGGLGLGLAIVKHLVEAHRGTITVNSAGQGKGSTFIVELPVIAVEVSEPNPLPEAV